MIKRNPPSLFGDDYGCGAIQPRKKSRDEVFKDYDSFVDKFNEPKTTDDCYTPPAVYECVLQWAREKCNIPADAHIVRPFYPGGDYENYPYQPEDVVVDNPPFSILSKIRAFYYSHGIPYFLFGPALTLCNAYREYEKVTYIVADANITYENGAEVCTGFITNLWPRDDILVVAGDLNKRVDEVQKITKVDKSKPVYKYPPNVISTALLCKIATRGIEWSVPRSEAYLITDLESLKAQGKRIFGYGFLISDRLAAERLAAERLAAERLAAERLAPRETFYWELSEREKQIIKELSNPTNNETI